LYRRRPEGEAIDIGHLQTLAAQVQTDYQAAVQLHRESLAARDHAILAEGVAQTARNEAQAARIAAEVARDGALAAQAGTRVAYGIAGKGKEVDTQPLGTGAEGGSIGHAGSAEQKTEKALAVAEGILGDIKKLLRVYEGVVESGSPQSPENTMAQWKRLFDVLAPIMMNENMISLQKTVVDTAQRATDAADNVALMGHNFESSPFRGPPETTRNPEQQQLIPRWQRPLPNKHALVDRLRQVRGLGSGLVEGSGARKIIEPRTRRLTQEGEKWGDSGLESVKHPESKLPPRSSFMSRWSTLTAEAIPKPIQEAIVETSTPITKYDHWFSVSKQEVGGSGGGGMQGGVGSPQGGTARSAGPGAQEGKGGAEVSTARPQYRRAPKATTEKRAQQQGNSAQDGTHTPVPEAAIEQSADLRAHMLKDPSSHYEETEEYRKWVAENERGLVGIDRARCQKERMKFFGQYSEYWQTTLGKYGEIARIRWESTPSKFWGQPWDPAGFQNGHTPQWKYPFEEPSGSGGGNKGKGKGPSGGGRDHTGAPPRSGVQHKLVERLFHPENQTQQPEQAKRQQVNTEQHTTNSAQETGTEQAGEEVRKEDEHRLESERAEDKRKAEEKRKAVEEALKAGRKQESSLGGGLAAIFRSVIEREDEETRLKQVELEKIVRAEHRVKRVAMKQRLKVYSKTSTSRTAMAAYARRAMYGIKYVSPIHLVLIQELVPIIWQKTCSEKWGTNNAGWETLSTPLQYLQEEVERTLVQNKRKYELSWPRGLRLPVDYRDDVAGAVKWLLSQSQSDAPRITVTSWEKGGETGSGKKEGEAMLEKGKGEAIAKEGEGETIAEKERVKNIMRRRDQGGEKVGREEGDTGGKEVKKKATEKREQEGEQGVERDTEKEKKKGTEKQEQKGEQGVQGDREKGEEEVEGQGGVKQTMKKQRGEKEGAKGSNEGGTEPEEPDTQSKPLKRAGRRSSAAQHLRKIGAGLDEQPPPDGAGTAELTRTGGTTATYKFQSTHAGENSGPGGASSAGGGSGNSHSRFGGTTRAPATEAQETKSTHTGGNSGIDDASGTGNGSGSRGASVTELLGSIDRPTSTTMQLLQPTRTANDGSAPGDGGAARVTGASIDAKVYTGEGSGPGDASRRSGGDSGSLGGGSHAALGISTRSQATDSLTVHNESQSTQTRGTGDTSGTGGGSGIYGGDSHGLMLTPRSKSSTSAATGKYKRSSQTPKTSRSRIRERTQRIMDATLESAKGWARQENSVQAMSDKVASVLQLRFAARKRGPKTQGGVRIGGQIERVAIAATGQSETGEVSGAESLQDLSAHTKALGRARSHFISSQAAAVAGRGKYELQETVEGSGTPGVSQQDLTEALQALEKTFMGYLRLLIDETKYRTLDAWLDARSKFENMIWWSWAQLEALMECPTLKLAELGSWDNHGFARIGTATVSQIRQWGWNKPPVRTIHPPPPVTFDISQIHPDDDVLPYLGPSVDPNTMRPTAAEEKRRRQFALCSFCGSDKHNDRSDCWHRIARAIEMDRVALWEWMLYYQEDSFLTSRREAAELRIRQETFELHNTPIFTSEDDIYPYTGPGICPISGRPKLEEIKRRQGSSLCLFCSEPEHQWNSCPVRDQAAEDMKATRMQHELDVAQNKRKLDDYFQKTGEALRSARDPILEEIPQESDVEELKKFNEQQIQIQSYGEYHHGMEWQQEEVDSQTQVMDVEPTDAMEVGSSGEVGSHTEAMDIESTDVVEVGSRGEVGSNTEAMDIEPTDTMAVRGKEEVLIDLGEPMEGMEQTTEGAASSGGADSIMSDYPPGLDTSQEQQQQQDKRSAQLELEQPLYGNAQIKPQVGQSGQSSREIPNPESSAGAQGASTLIRLVSNLVHHTSGEALATQGDMFGQSSPEVQPHPSRGIHSLAHQDQDLPRASGGAWADLASLQQSQQGQDAPPQPDEVEAAGSGPLGSSQIGKPQTGWQGAGSTPQHGGEDPQSGAVIQDAGGVHSARDELYPPAAEIKQPESDSEHQIRQGMGGAHMTKQEPGRKREVDAEQGATTMTATVGSTSMNSPIDHISMLRAPPIAAGQVLGLPITRAASAPGRRPRAGPIWQTGAKPGHPADGEVHVDLQRDSADEASSDEERERAEIEGRAPILRPKSMGVLDSPRRVDFEPGTKEHDGPVSPGDNTHTPGNPGVMGEGGGSHSSSSNTGSGEGNSGTVVAGRPILPLPRPRSQRFGRLRDSIPSPTRLPQRPQEDERFLVNMLAEGLGVQVDEDEDMKTRPQKDVKGGSNPGNGGVERMDVSSAAQSRSEGISGSSDESMIEGGNSESRGSDTQLAGPVAMPPPMRTARRTQSAGVGWGIKAIASQDSGSGGRAEVVRVAGSKYSDTRITIYHLYPIPYDRCSLEYTLFGFLSVISDGT